MATHKSTELRCSGAIARRLWPSQAGSEQHRSVATQCALRLVSGLSTIIIIVPSDQPAFAIFRLADG